MQFRSYKYIGVIQGQTCSSEVEHKVFPGFSWTVANLGVKWVVMGGGGREALLSVYDFAGGGSFSTSYSFKQ